MADEIWDIILRTSSDAPTISPKETLLSKWNLPDRLPDIGTPPPLTLPENTRLVLLKKMILRLLKIYTRNMDIIHNWLLKEINNERRTINTLITAISSFDQSLDRRLDERLAKSIEPLKSELNTRIQEFESSVSDLSAKVHDFDSLRQSTSTSDYDNPFIEGARSVLRHDGILSEAGLWFNPAIVIKFENNWPLVDQIHERIIEKGLAIAELYMRCKPGAAVLDIGCGESLLPIEFASMGYHVTCIDLKPYPLSHTNLTVIQGNFLTTPLSQNYFDFVSCVSSIEHFGLNWYRARNISTTTVDPDTLAIKKVCSVLKQDGYLFLSLPYADNCRIDLLERTYDRHAIDSLIGQSGLQEFSRRVFCREGQTEWLEIPHTDSVGPRKAVAILLLRKDDTSQCE